MVQGQRHFISSLNGDKEVDHPHVTTESDLIRFLAGLSPPDTCFTISSRLDIETLSAQPMVYWSSSISTVSNDRVDLAANFRELLYAAHKAVRIATTCWLLKRTGLYFWPQCKQSWVTSFASFMDALFEQISKIYLILA